MIPHKYELVRVAERTKTSWQGDLRGFVDNAVVEFTASK